MQTHAGSHQNTIVAMWSEMDRWVVPAAVLLSGTLPDGWEIAKIGEVVEIMTERIQVEPDRDYKMAGVRWYGEGVFHRETVSGKKLSAKYIAPIKPSAFIYNRLFGWKASFAVVPEGLADCYVSSEFPQFVANEAKLIPEYLYLWSICESTIRAVNAASTGSAAVSRNRFREEFFLEFEIPLPPLDDQRTIVSTWERTKSEIGDIQGRISTLEEQIEVDFLAALGLRKPEHMELPKVFSVQWSNFSRWSIEYIKRTICETRADRSKYPLYFLGDLCDGQSGSTPSKRNKAFWNGDIPWVSPKDMKTDIISDTIDHITDEAIAAGNAPLVPPNSVLVVVRSGILQHTVPIAVNTTEVSINQDMRALIPKADVPVIGDYIAVFLTCSQHKLLAQVKWSTTVQSINRESIQNLEIPLPPLEIQKQLIEKVTAQRKVVYELKSKAEERSVMAKKDMEAMILGTKPIPNIN